MLSHALVHNTIANASGFLLIVAGASVLCALGGLLASRLRRFSASSRHLVLSLALLAVPFSALVAITPVARVATFARHVGAAAVSIGETRSIVPMQSAPAPSEVRCILMLVWTAGAAAISLLFALQWMAARKLWRSADERPDEETQALFDLEAQGTRVRLTISDRVSEPMVVGFFRPLILLPRSYSGGLKRDELTSVFAHEIEHVRRRDNLSAAIHEAVSAIFWFDPFHWIARRHLLELRERACDERVLKRGYAPRAYIAALAKACHTSIQTPTVACMSGFHVRKRIESIMTYSTDSARFVSDRYVRTTAITALLAIVASFVLLVPSPSLGASESNRPAEPYILIAHVRPLDADRVFVSATVLAGGTDIDQKGPIPALFGMSSPAQTGVPVGASSTGRGVTYHIKVTPDATGGVATLVVKDGDTVIYTTTKTVQMDAGLKNANVTSDPAIAEIEKNATHVTGDMTPPRVVSRVDPVYPAEAKAARVAGIVVVEALIDEHGIVRSTKVIKPLPYGLDTAAENAIRQWVLSPALRNGKPVPVIFNVSVRFAAE